MTCLQLCVLFNFQIRVTFSPVFMNSFFRSRLTLYKCVISPCIQRSWGIRNWSIRCVYVGGGRGRREKNKIVRQPVTFQFSLFQLKVIASIKRKRDTCFLLYIVFLLPRLLMAVEKRDKNYINNCVLQSSASSTGSSTNLVNTVTMQPHNALYHILTAYSLPHRIRLSYGKSLRLMRQ